MKNLRSRELVAFEQRHPAGPNSEWGGCFRIPFTDKSRFPHQLIWLNVIASRGNPTSSDPIEQWDHVSVSTPTRCPTWAEMCHIKTLFFERDEEAMQLHPVRDYINNHPYCLHLWRPTVGPAIPLPPSILVGIPAFNP